MEGHFERDPRGPKGGQGDPRGPRGPLGSFRSGGEGESEWRVISRGTNGGTQGPGAEFNHLRGLGQKLLKMHPKTTDFDHLGGLGPKLLKMDPQK